MGQTNKVTTAPAGVGSGSNLVSDFCIYIPHHFQLHWLSQWWDFYPNRAEQQHIHPLAPISACNSNNWNNGNHRNNGNNRNNGKHRKYGKNRNNGNNRIPELSVPWEPDWNTKTPLRNLPLSGHWGCDRNPYFFCQSWALFCCLCLPEEPLHALLWFFSLHFLFLEHKTLCNYSSAAIRRDPSVQELLKITPQKIL